MSSKTKNGKSRSEGGRSDAGGENSNFAGDSDLDHGSNEDKNPHSKIIEKKFLSGFKKNRYYIESLKLSDLKKIDFGQHGLPNFA